MPTFNELSRPSYWLGLQFHNHYYKDFPKMFPQKENDMSDTALDFNISDIANIKAELEKGIPALITALDVADKFVSVLDPSLAPALEIAIKVLTAFETVATKE